MGSEIAVGITEVMQPYLQQTEMVGLFTRHPHPIVVKLSRHVTKAVNRIPRQIDGVEFDVCHGMDQSDSPYLGIKPPFRQLARRHQ